MLMNFFLNNGKEPLPNQKKSVSAVFVLEQKNTFSGYWRHAFGDSYRLA